MSPIPNFTPDSLRLLREAQQALTRFDVLLPPVLRINADLILAKARLATAIGELILERSDAARMLKNAEGGVTADRRPDTVIKRDFPEPGGVK